MSTNVTMTDLPRVGPRRYTSTAQALHWITAALIFTTLPIAWVMVNMSPAFHSRGWLFTVHKSIGVTILVIVAARLAWRSAHPAPALPGTLSQVEKAAALASHAMLYVILLGMPISGYIFSVAGGHPVSYFGLFTLPTLPKNRGLAEAAVWVHVAIGQWLLYALILLHLAGAAWHAAVRRDGVLNRMLPQQSGQD